MARTEEERKTRADEFRKQFLGKPGQKSIQRALRPRIAPDEIPQKSPRGEFTRHPPAWHHIVKVSSSAQKILADEVRAETTAIARFSQVVQQIQTHADRLAVADANIWLHGISTQESYPDCVQLVGMIEDGQLSPCVSSGIVKEITIVGQRLQKDNQFTPDDYERLVALMAQAINVDPLPRESAWPIIGADHSDDKYLAVARRARNFSQGNQVPVITIDKHILTAPNGFVGETTIMTPLTFLGWIKNK